MSRSEKVCIVVGFDPPVMSSVPEDSPPPPPLHVYSRRQPRENPLQNTTTHPIILPKTDFLPVTDLPLESIFKTPSPFLQRLNLLQVFPPKRLLSINPLISQSSPATVFRLKDILPETSFVRPKMPNPFPSKIEIF